MGLKPRIRRGIRSKVEVIKIIIFKHGGAQGGSEKWYFQKCCSFGSRHKYRHPSDTALVPRWLECCTAYCFVVDVSRSPPFEMRKTKGTMTRAKNNHNREISFRFQDCCNLISFFSGCFIDSHFKISPWIFSGQT